MVFRGATQVLTVDGRRALMVEELRASASRLPWTAFVVGRLPGFRCDNFSIGRDFLG